MTVFQYGPAEAVYVDSESLVLGFAYAYKLRDALCFARSRIMAQLHDLRLPGMVYPSGSLPGSSTLSSAF